MEKDSDLESNATEVSTAASMTMTAVDEAEVERVAMLDKEVLKHATFELADWGPIHDGCNEPGEAHWAFRRFDVRFRPQSC